MNIANFAHRGARSLAPENSMPAVKKAWDLGTDGIEVDVTVTRDGHLILHHDLTLERTTDISEVFPDRSTLSVSSFTYDELQQLDNGSWYIDSDPFEQIRAGNVSFEDMESFQKSHIASLEEALLFIKDKPWRINLELKDIAPPRSEYPIAEKTIKLIKRLKIHPEQVIISSFDHKKIDIVHKLEPAIEINALIGSKSYNKWGSYPYSIYNANADFIDKEQIIKAKEHKCRVNLYTVNDPEKMRLFIEWGVSGLITDFPQVLASIINQSGTNDNSLHQKSV